MKVIIDYLRGVLSYWFLLVPGGALTLVDLVAKLRGKQIKIPIRWVVGIFGISLIVAQFLTYRDLWQTARKDWDCPNAVIFSQTPVEAYSPTSAYGLLVTLRALPKAERKRLRVFTTSSITDVVVTVEVRDKDLQGPDVHFAGKVADITLYAGAPKEFRIFSSDPFSVACIEELKMR